MKKSDRQEMIYRIALAGISAALAIIFVTLGVYVRFTTVAFFIAAELAIMTPLTKRYYFSSIAAFVVSAVASFFIAGADVYAVAGYLIYFGPMAIITGIMYNAKLKWYFAIPIKLIYINGALALLYFVLGTIVIDPSVMEILPYWSIALVGSILLTGIDLVLQFIYSRMIRIVDKALRAASRKKDTPVAVEEDEEPFEEEMYSDIYPKTPESEEGRAQAADEGARSFDDGNDMPSDMENTKFFDEAGCREENDIKPEEEPHSAENGVQPDEAEESVKSNE